MTLIKYYHDFNDSITHLCLIPYYALFCSETYSILETNEFKFGTKENLSKIRLSLKMYCDKYGRNIQKLKLIDNIQNDEFVNRLRFDFMKDWNIHYNLGVYFDNRNNILSNTQNINQIKVGESHIDELTKEEAINFGKDIGTLVTTITNMVSQEKLNFNVDRSKNNYNYKYKDYNTNLSDFYKSYTKEINLYLLNIISNINFLLYRVRRVLSENSTYLFRIMYISYYYAIQSLDRLKKHIEQNEYPIEVKNICNELTYNSYLMNGNIRSCMMHYGFKNRDEYLIKEEFLNVDIPFYGLIESQFNGKTFEVVNNELIEGLLLISKSIDFVLNLNKENLEYLYD